VVLLAVVTSLLAGCADLRSSGTQHPADTRRLGVLTRETGCVEHDGLPDRRCTPGAVRVGISLSVICQYGYTRSIRPAESYTEPLKLRQMRAYGLSGSPRDYEEDHLVPLSTGGAPSDSANLWPEPRSGPNNAEQKDRLETWVARMACGHRLPLARLQRDMADDWTALYRAVGGERVLQHYPPGG
jgi:hypothetical protein